MSARRWLLFGGLGSFAIAALHLIVIFVGAPGYEYFGAGELAPMVTAGSILPGLVTAALVALFVVWGLYAMSGLGLIRRLPLLRTGLIIIAAMYLLRGVSVFPQLISLATSTEGLPARYVAFSAGAFVLGACYLAGLLGCWRTLSSAAGNRGVETGHA